MAPISKTQIFNMVFGNIGDAPITDPNESRAEICNIFYDPSRREVLEAHPWRFAGKRAALALLSATPAWEYDYQYQLPADCVAVRELSDTSYLWEVEGDALLTNMEDAYALYTYDVEDTTKFTPTFVKALSLKLAVDIVGSKKPFDGKKKSALFQQYLLMISAAQTIDDRFSNAPLPTTTSKFVSDRT